MSFFPPDWGLYLIYLCPKNPENIWQTDAEMFVERMLNLNVIALKVSGARSQAMGTFFSLKEHSQVCTVLMTLFTGIPPTFSWCHHYCKRL